MVDTIDGLVLDSRCHCQSDGDCGCLRLLGVNWVFVVACGCLWLLVVNWMRQIHLRAHKLIHIQVPRFLKAQQIQYIRY